MYIYKTEILRASFKWFSDKADEKDIEQLDKFINEKYSDGWELVTYNYMATSTQGSVKDFSQIGLQALA